MSRVRVALVAAVFALAAVMAVAWWTRGSLDEDDGAADDCGRATLAEVERAHERYAAVNLLDQGAVSSGSGYRDPAVTGHGIGEEQGSPVLVVLVVDGSSEGRPACFEGVPVRYERGGPFFAQ